MWMIVISEPHFYIITSNIIKFNLWEIRDVTPTKSIVSFPLNCYKSRCEQTFFTTRAIALVFLSFFWLTFLHPPQLTNILSTMSEIMIFVILIPVNSVIFFIRLIGYSHWYFCTFCVHSKSSIIPVKSKTTVVII